MDYPCTCFAWAWTLSAVLLTLLVWGFSALVYPFL